MPRHKGDLNLAGVPQGVYLVSVKTCKRIESVSKGRLIGPART